jgi:hypothetical protein
VSRDEGRKQKEALVKLNCKDRMPIKKKKNKNKKNKNKKKKKNKKRRRRRRRRRIRRRRILLYKSTTILWHFQG